MKKIMFSVLIILVISLVVTSFTLGIENEVIEPSQEIILMGEIPQVWAQPSVSILEKNGLVQNDLLIDYDQEMTREEFCESIVSIIEKVQGEDLSVGENPFIDTLNPMILKAYYSGITKGKGNGIFAPDEKISRQAYATMLYRGMKLLEVIETDSNSSLESFTDEEKIATWAKEAVSFLYHAGLMNGVGNNQIAPLELTDRNQGLTLLARTFIRYDDPSKNDYENLLALKGGYVIPENKALDEETKDKQKNCEHEWFFYDYASNHPHEKVYFCSKCQGLSIKPYDSSPEAYSHWDWKAFSYNENHPHEIVEKCSRCDELNIRNDLTKKWTWEEFTYNQIHPHELISKCSICGKLFVDGEGKTKAFEIIDGKCSICGINIEAYINHFRNRVLNNENITDELAIQGIHYIRPLRSSEQAINPILSAFEYNSDSKGYLIIEDVSLLNEFLEDPSLRLPNTMAIELLFETYSLDTLVNEMGWPEGNYYYQNEDNVIEEYIFSDAYENSYFIFLYESF
jgi:hypothetical protein